MRFLAVCLLFIGIQNSHARLGEHLPDKAIVGNKIAGLIASEYVALANKKIENFNKLSISKLRKKFINKKDREYFDKVSRVAFGHSVLRASAVKGGWKIKVSKKVNVKFSLEDMINGDVRINGNKFHLFAGESYLSLVHRIQGFVKTKLKAGKVSSFFGSFLLDSAQAEEIDDLRGMLTVTLSGLVSVDYSPQAWVFVEHALRAEVIKDHLLKKSSDLHLSCRLSIQSMGTTKVNQDYDLMEKLGSLITHGEFDPYKILSNLLLRNIRNSREADVFTQVNVDDPACANAYPGSKTMVKCMKRARKLSGKSKLYGEGSPRDNQGNFIHVGSDDAPKDFYKYCKGVVENAFLPYPKNKSDKKRNKRYSESICARVGSAAKCLARLVATNYRNHNKNISEGKRSLMIDPVGEFIRFPGKVITTPPYSDRIKTMLK